ncbi:MAG TPA: diguanylate cyclase, partial [Acidocella sp.]|nr:diguanylate cyclase [Acidocella sp.]
MLSAPSSKNEALRLAALRGLGILDSQPSAAFEALAKAASLLCDTPISLISLIDENRQWIKANVGLEEVSEIPRDLSFCAHTILGDVLLEVADASADSRFSENPLVLGRPNVHFYAGAPLSLADGNRVGAICVMDHAPRQLDDRQREGLACLALAATQALEHHRSGRLLREAADDLRQTHEFLERKGRAGSVGGWSLDLESHQLTWSPETYRLYGLPTDYVPRLEETFSFYAPEARAQIAKAVEDARVLGKAYDIELPFTRADGERQWIRSIGERILEPGKPARLVGAFQDITARHAEQMALKEAKERMAIATDSARIGIWDWAIETESMYWNDWMYRLFGLSPGKDSVHPSSWQDHVHPHDLEATKLAIRAALDNTQAFDTEFRIHRAGDNEICHLRATAEVTFDENGVAVRMVGAMWDVTESRRLAAELSDQHELLRVTLLSIGDGVITTNAQGITTWLNPSAERLTGWQAAEVSGKPLSEVFVILNEQTREPAENPVAVCHAQGRIVGLANHTLLVSRRGSEYGIEASAAPIRNEAGETLGAVLVFHDVTEQRQLSGEMSHRATHDALTGLLNRPEFEARLRYMLHTARSDRSQNVLLFLDLDQFKLVNDTCGHAAGDELLVQVGKILTDIVRASDTVSRLGGDEFAIMFDHCSIEKALPVAQKICDRLEDFRFTYQNQRCRVGASIGLVPVDQRWASTAAVMQAADASCYAAKEAGRNRVHVWFDSDQAMRARQGETQWATRLAQALDDDNFVLFAQRIIKLDEAVSEVAQGVHAEVLLRLAGRNGTLSLPGAFLPAAERFHLASRIDRWVLSRTIRWMNAAHSLASIDTLCVNLSGQSIGDEAFHRWAIAMLSEAGSNICRRLCIEITETAAVTNLAD